MSTNKLVWIFLTAINTLPFLTLIAFAFMLEPETKKEIPDSYAIGYKDGYDKAALDIAEMNQD